MPQFGTTPLSTTTLGSNQFPVSAAFVPGSGVAGNTTAIEGIAINTDVNGFQTTAMRIGLLDGDDVTLGHKADAKSTATDTTAVTIMSVLKQISFMAQNPASTPVTGTFWQATQPISGTVTANAGTNLNTSALALDTSVNGILLAQASTTSGQKGPIIQGAVTTGAPSYTTAQTSPLSLNTSGGLRVDGSGATQPVSGTFWQATQPVSGTVTANAGTNLNTSALALETGGNLATLVTNTADLLADGDFLATLGNKTDAKSTATDTTSISIMQVLKEISAMVQAPASTPVTGTFWQATQPISAASLPALPAHQSTNVDQWNGTTTDTNSGVKSAGTLRVVIATDQPALTNKLLVTPDSIALPAHQSVNVDQLNGTTTDTNSGTKSAGTLRVVLATDQPALTNAQPVNLNTVNGSALSATNPVFTAQAQSATATITSVAGAASDTSLLASNTSRKGAYFYNDSTAILYLELGSAAATTSVYTVQMPAQSFYEIPTYPVYTGAIRGIWSSAAGNVRITEMS